MPINSNDVQAVALLDEPVRRALYEWVAATGRAVGRDEAAAAVGVSRALAAFHLDRLVRDDLLVPEYRRLSGRAGPGAGRPAKLYRRGPRELAVSLPERRYDVAAGLFAEALDQLGDGKPPDALRDAAREAGRTVGATARKHAGARAGRARMRRALVDVLAERGYEPHEVGPEVRLGNCPFHALVEDHREVVCGMNLALAEGVLAGLGVSGLKARLDPQSGRCCVAMGLAAADG